MGTYAEQKIREKRKQLEKLENQLFDMHRAVDLVTAEIATLEDVVKHDKSESKGHAATKGQSSHKAPALEPQKPGPAGHWAGILANLGRLDRFTIDDVVRELAAIGQPHKRPSIRAKLADYSASGKVKRLGGGVFAVLPPGISGNEMRARGIIPPQARLVGEDA
jgi:hypothetical protein